MDTVVFTTAGLLELLTSIDELRNVDISITEAPNHDIQLQIGQSVYTIYNPGDDEVMISEEAVRAIQDINEEVYEDVADEIDDNAEVVEGGPITQIAKTLLVGGLVRLGAKMLK